MKTCSNRRAHKRTIVERHDFVWHFRRVFWKVGTRRSPGVARVADPSPNIGHSHTNWQHIASTMSALARPVALPVPTARPMGARAVRAQPRSLVVRRAVDMAVRMYPDPVFIEDTIKAFPNKSVANAEEARALVAEGGYKFLDVRSELARTEGPLMSSIHIPLTKAKRRFDSSTRQSVYDYTEISESEWMAQVTKKIPSKDTKLIVVCADGTTNAVRALEALDGAGYKNLVGLRGGYLRFNQSFDVKGNRRVYTEYKEDYSHSADSAGIHASGAGFAKMDPLIKYDIIIH